MWRGSRRITAAPLPALLREEHGSHEKHDHRSNADRLQYLMCHPGFPLRYRIFENRPNLVSTADFITVKNRNTHVDLVTRAWRICVGALRVLGYDSANYSDTSVEASNAKAI